MVDLLMSQSSIVLEDVVVFRPGRHNYLLRHRQDFDELIVRNVGELGAMVLGNDKLENGQRVHTSSQYFARHVALQNHTAGKWPTLDRMDVQVAGGRSTYCMSFAQWLDVKES